MRNPPQSYGPSSAVRDHVTYHPTHVNTPRHNPSQASQKAYTINRPWRDGRLSWPRWLAMNQNGLPIRRLSPIQVLTGPDIEW